MYIRPSNNKRLGPIAALLALIVPLTIFIIIAISMFDRDDQESVTIPGQPYVHAPQAIPQPAKNPVDEAVKPRRQGVVQRDGVAAAILIDTSGSMNDQVTDSKGGRSAKIAIAKKCLSDLVSQADRVAKQHPDRTVVLGIYEFSARDSAAECRKIVPLGPPNPQAVQAALSRMHADGGTPIGDAMIRVKRDLDATGLSHLHILVVTDGENNRGYALDDVVGAMSRLDEAFRPSMYFIAFDVAESKFAPLRQAGAMVLPAGNETELQQTLDYVLTGKILAEQPDMPRK